MNALQLNAELYRTLGQIAENETLLEKTLKYVKKLAAKKPDPTLMSKDEFFRRVDESLEQARQGRVHRMNPGESLDDFLKRVG
ncbi:MAG: hypothetical protein IKQ68_04750 [Prevotella sp.]|nr:hypothetical protein [Prevotella sp.]